jgi:hypothetical protein
MIASFKDIAAAMTRCVAIIEDYARLAPSTLTTTAALHAVHDGASAADALITAAGGKKTRAKKEKKIKDPNAPKRPPSAYLLFQNDIREQIRTAHPGLPYKEVLTVIATRWKELDDNARKVYEDAYNQATANFRLQEEAYKLTGVIPRHLLDVVALPTSFDSDDDSSSDGGQTPSKLPATLAVATPITSAKKVTKRKSDVIATPLLDTGKKEVSLLLLRVKVKKLTIIRRRPRARSRTGRVVVSKAVATRCLPELL